MRSEISNRDWLGKASAGIVCGFVFALGASGFFKFVIGAGPALYGVESQVSIQLFPMVWTPIVSFCFLFSSTRQAWGWLGFANGVLWGLLFALGVTA